MSDHVRVRYIVDDVPATVDFSTRLLDQGPGGAARPAADGRRPQPGGWNRIQLQVADLEAEVNRLDMAGARSRSATITGRGCSQILLEDPSGHPIDLFQPAA